MQQSLQSYLISSKFVNLVLNARIADVQERVSTGKSILRASDDPVAAVNLSVAKEQSLLLQQFQKH